MSVAFNITPLKHVDLPKLRIPFLAVVNSMVGISPTDKKVHIAKFNHYFLPQNGKKCLVAKKASGEIIGFLSYKPISKSRRSFARDATLWVDWIGVAPKHQRAKVAESLYDAFRHEVEPLGHKAYASAIAEKNKPSQKFAIRNKRSPSHPRRFRVGNSIVRIYSGKIENIMLASRP